AEPDMGSKLYAAFKAAGLAPKLVGGVRIEGGDESAGFEYLAETMRTLLPGMVAAGIATEAEIGIDTLADRLRAEAVAGGHCVFYPRLIGAWAPASEMSASSAA